MQKFDNLISTSGFLFTTGIINLDFTCDERTAWQQLFDEILTADQESTYGSVTRKWLATTDEIFQEKLGERLWEKLKPLIGRESQAIGKLKRLETSLADQSR